MNMHTVCLSLMGWLQNLQEFDSSFKSYGDPYPDFESKLDDKLYSLLFTGFGMVPNPAWRESKQVKATMGSRFLAHLEASFCRRNYQERINNLETALSVAVEKYGEDKIAALAQRTEINLWGEAYVDGLKKGGFIFKDAAFLDRMLKKAKEIGNQRHEARVSERNRLSDLRM